MADAATIHGGHNGGSVEQQARNVPVSHRPKRVGYLAATRFVENAASEQETGRGNEPCVCGPDHIFETALFGAILQGAAGLADVDDLLQPLVLVSAAMDEGNEQQSFGRLRRRGDRLVRQRYHLVKAVGVNQVGLHFDHHAGVVAMQPFALPPVGFSQLKSMVREHRIDPRQGFRCGQYVDVGEAAQRRRRIKRVGKYRSLDDRGRNAAQVSHQDVGLVPEQQGERRIGTVAIARRVVAGAECAVVLKRRKVLQESTEHAMRLCPLDQVTDTRQWKGPAR